jgi:hypothetical protein
MMFARLAFRTCESFGSEREIGLPNSQEFPPKPHFGVRRLRRSDSPAKGVRRRHACASQESVPRPDPAEITPLTLAACDRHTHQARTNSRKEFFELPRGEMWYVPFEILSVLRLRESMELPNPELDHPLMKTALARLEPITAPYTDALLDSVLAMMARQLPLRHFN